MLISILFNMFFKLKSLTTEQNDKNLDEYVLKFKPKRLARFFNFEEFEYRYSSLDTKIVLEGNKIKIVERKDLLK